MPFQMKSIPNEVFLFYLSPQSNVHSKLKQPNNSSNYQLYSYKQEYTVYKCAWYMIVYMCMCERQIRKMLKS